MSTTRSFAILGTALFYFVISVGYAQAAEVPDQAPCVREAAQAPTPPADPDIFFVTPKMLMKRNFYVTVGRPDLADAWTRRRAARFMVRGVGAGVLAGGFLWFLKNYTENVSLVCLDNACDEANRQADVPTTGPLITMGAGALLMLVPNLWENDPVSSAKRAELLDEARERGLRIVPTLEVTAAPAARGAGGTVALSGRF